MSGKMMFTSATVLTLGSGLWAASAGAALLVSESFDYGTGNVSGNGSAVDTATSTGWSGAWASGSSTSQVVTSPGLTYGSTTSPGNASTDNTTGTMLNYRPFNATGLTDNGDVLWYSFIFNVPSVSGNSGLGRVRLFATDGATQGVGVDIGANGSSSTATLQAMIRESSQNAAGNTNAGTVTFNLGQTYLVVGRVEFTATNNADKNEIWVNPTATTEAGLGAAQSKWLANINLNGTGTNGGGWMIRGDGSWKGTVDELRLGEIYADVIPEPASLALLGLGGLLMVGRSRRSAR